MAKRNGGSHQKKEFDTQNNIFFDKHVADWMFNWFFDNIYINNIIVKTTDIFLDACCGNGVLGDSFCKAKDKMFKYPYDIDYVDNNVKESLKFKNRDILYWKPEYKYNIIICNPPWTPVELAEEIYHHLLTLLEPGGILLFIINYSFVNTNWKRGEQLGNGITIFLPRYTFHKSLKNNNSDSTGLLDPVLMINRQNKIDLPFFCPIPPTICKNDQIIMRV